MCILSVPSLICEPTEGTIPVVCFPHSRVEWMYDYQGMVIGRATRCGGRGRWRTSSGRSGDGHEESFIRRLMPWWCR